MTASARTLRSNALFQINDQKSGDTGPECGNNPAAFWTWRNAIGYERTCPRNRGLSTLSAEKLTLIREAT
jgi:hypothetical protein